RYGSIPGNGLGMSVYSRVPRIARLGRPGRRTGASPTEGEQCIVTVEPSRGKKVVGRVWRHRPVRVAPLPPRRYTVRRGAGCLRPGRLFLPRRNPPMPTRCAAALPAAGSLAAAALAQSPAPAVTGSEPQVCLEVRVVTLSEAFCERVQGVFTPNPPAT